MWLAQRSPTATTVPTVGLFSATASPSAQRSRATTSGSNASCVLGHARRCVRRSARLGRSSNAKTRHALLGASDLGWLAAASRTRSHRDSRRRRSGVLRQLLRHSSGNNRCQVAPLPSVAGARWPIHVLSLPALLLGRIRPSFHLPDPFVTGVGVLGCSVCVSGELKKKVRSLI